MTRRYSRYPIGELLLLVLERSGLRVSDFVATIGYQNVNRGIKRFDQWLRTGTGSRQFLDGLLQSSVGPSPEELDAALEQTRVILDAEEKERRAQLRAEEKKRFLPILQGVTEFREPSSITLYAISGGAIRYTIFLPREIKTWDGVTKSDWIREAIKNNYNKNLGKTIGMGRILGYNLFWEYGGKPVRYSVQGELIDEVNIEHG